MGKNLLEGKRGIIFGALDEESIAWSVARKAYDEGARFTLTNAPVALRMGKIQELADATESQVISADATKPDELESLINQSTEALGGKLDFILHAVGMSANVRKSKPYTSTNYDFFQKTLDISGLSLHKTLQTAYHLDAMNAGGSVVTLSYIAAQRTFPDYNDMSEAKAVLETVVRNFGYHLGQEKGVRVNAVSQSPTLTTAGKGIKGFEAFYNYANHMAPLGNAPTDACADYCVSLFSDYTRMVTMQTLYHDGGFSSVGVSQSVMDQFAPPDE